MTKTIQEFVPPTKTVQHPDDWSVEAQTALRQELDEIAKGPVKEITDIDAFIKSLRK